MPPRCEFMLSRPALFLVVKIRFKKFRITVPLPLYIFLIFLEMALDFFDFIMLFIPKKKHAVAVNKDSASIITAFSVVRTVYTVVFELMESCSSWELCSIETQDFMINVKFI